MFLEKKNNAIGSESKVLQKSESNNLGYFEKRDNDEPSEEELEESVSTEYHIKTKRDFKNRGSKPCSSCRMKKSLKFFNYLK